MINELQPSRLRASMIYPRLFNTITDKTIQKKCPKNRSFSEVAKGSRKLQPRQPKASMVLQTQQLLQIQYQVEPLVEPQYLHIYQNNHNPSFQL